MAIYDEARLQSPPDNHIQVIAHSSNRPETPAKPHYGIDSYLGLLASSAAAPLYLYSSLKGKFEVWDEILDGMPDNCFLDPTLDVGSGRGMVLLNVAERKKELEKNKISARGGPSPPTQEVFPAYGIDTFDTSDLRGVSPVETYKNAAAVGVIDFTVLHTASFTEKFPFADGVFSLVTSNLVLHNAKKEGRIKAVREMARVCAPQGRVVIVDLWGSFKDHQTVLEALGWEKVKVSRVGFRMSYGVVPCQMLIALKPGLKA